MNGGRLCNNSLLQPIWFYVLLFEILFFMTVSASASRSAYDLLYIASFSADTAPSSVCAVFLFNSDKTEMSCSSHILPIEFSDGLSEERTGAPLSTDRKRFIAGIPVNYDLSESKGNSSGSAILLILRNDESETDFLPVQVFNRKNLYHLGSFDKKVFGKELSVYSERRQELEREIENLEMEIQEKKQVMVTTPEGREYADLRSKREVLESVKKDLEDYIVTSEERMKIFMKNLAHTPDHKTVKSDRSSKIKKMVEMSLQK